MTPYKIPRTTAKTEQVIRSSRFICHLGPASTRKQAIREIDAIREQHPKANHVCWAFIAGSPDSGEHGYNDDGEPHGTAGKPILTMLEYSGFGEIWATVTRYFGGIKLGTGGLVRAYGSSVQQGLEIVESDVREALQPCTVICNYRYLSVFESLINEAKGRIVEKEFSEHVRLSLLIPAARVDALSLRMIDLSGNTIRLTKLDDRN